MSQRVREKRLDEAFVKNQHYYDHGRGQSHEQHHGETSLGGVNADLAQNLEAFADYIGQVVKNLGRILAGALISATPLSQWFLAFSMFVFLSLAMAKRYSELLHASDLVKTGNSGRGYRAGDRELLLSLGVGSSFSAVVIFSLYVHSQDVRLLYSSPEFLFLLCPIILYWLSRTWLLAHRGELKEDPVTLAIRDPVSYGVAAAAAAVIAVSMIHVS